MVAIASIPMGWVAYQLNWIRQRRDFAHQHDAEAESPFPMFMYDIPDAPWSLRLFGESSRYLMKVPDSEKHRARELFPEIFSR
jgi:hypothetical protein